MQISDPGKVRTSKPAVAHTLIGLGVFFNRNQPLSPSASTLQASVSRSLYSISIKTKSACLKQLYRLDRQPGQIDENRLLIEHAHQRHQVQAGRRSRSVRQRRRPHFEFLGGREQRPQLLDPCFVRPIAVADEQGSRIEPDDVAGFRSPRWPYLAQHRNLQLPAKICVRLRFRDAILLSGIHQHQAVIGGQRCVMRIDGIERERFRRGQTYDFGSGFARADGRGFVLPLRYGKIGSVLKPEFLPLLSLPLNAPSCIFRRAHHDPQQFAGHGMAIKSFGGRKRRHKKYFWHNKGLTIRNLKKRTRKRNARTTRQAGAGTMITTESQKQAPGVDRSLVVICVIACLNTLQ